MVIFLLCRTFHSFISLTLKQCRESHSEEIARLYTPAIYIVLGPWQMKRVHKQNLFSASVNPQLSEAIHASARGHGCIQATASCGGQPIPVVTPYIPSSTPPPTNPSPLFSASISASSSSLLVLIQVHWTHCHCSGFTNDDICSQNFTSVSCCYEVQCFKKWSFKAGNKNIFSIPARSCL